MKYCPPLRRRRQKKGTWGCRKEKKKLLYMKGPYFQAVNKSLSRRRKPQNQGVRAKGKKIWKRPAGIKKSA